MFVVIIFIFTGSITSVNFTKDGQCTLVSCLNNSIKLLDKESGELLAEWVFKILISINLLIVIFQRFKGHANSKYKIDSCLTSSDTIVLSGSEDGYIYCWDLVEVSFTNIINLINNNIKLIWFFRENYLLSCYTPKIVLFIHWVLIQHKSNW